MALPVLSQRLLVEQVAAADALQPSFASIPDGLSGVAVPAGSAGIAVVNCEKLGLLETSHTMRWNAGVTIGEVTIEVADEVNYTGAWSVALKDDGTPAVVTFSGTAPKVDVVRVRGSYGAYRHRITQPVVGGSVTTKIVGTT